MDRMLGWQELRTEDGGVGAFPLCSFPLVPGESEFPGCAGEVAPLVPVLRQVFVAAGRADGDCCLRASSG
jgi:hypothetical protein